MPNGQRRLRYVYFALTKRGHIKIGSTERLPKRWKELRELVIGEHGQYLAFFPGPMQFEFYLHSLFEKHRVPPSWYRRHKLKQGKELFYDKPGIRNWISNASNLFFLLSEYKSAGLTTKQALQLAPSNFWTCLQYHTLRMVFRGLDNNMSASAEFLGLRRQSLQRMLNDHPHDIPDFWERLDRTVDDTAVQSQLEGWRALKTALGLPQ